MSSGQSTEYGYKVEAREVHFFHMKPVVLSDGILGSDWREVQFEIVNNPAGIPVSLFDQKHNHGLLRHEGAIALAWTMIAQHDSRIECRLVQYKLETTYKCQRQGIVDMPVIQGQRRGDIKLVNVPQNTI
jgi:hypothetical protein